MTFLVSSGMGLMLSKNDDGLGPSTENLGDRADFLKVGRRLER